MFGSFGSGPNEPDVTKYNPLMLAFIGIHVPERQPEFDDFDDLLR